MGSPFLAATTLPAKASPKSLPVVRNTVAGFGAKVSEIMTLVSNRDWPVNRSTLACGNKLLISDFTLSEITPTPPVMYTFKGFFSSKKSFIS